jgi:hypothetical protein
MKEDVKAVRSNEDRIEYQGCSKETKRPISVEFADFLLGLRMGDEPRQLDSYNALMRIARSIAVKSGYRAQVRSGDWEEIAHDCIVKELNRHKELTAFEIVRRGSAEEFAYLGIAFKWRLIDRFRKIDRRNENALPERYDLMSTTPLRNSATNCTRMKDLENNWNREFVAEQFHRSAESFPSGPSAISRVAAELMQNPDHLYDLADRYVSPTAFKSGLVDHIAKIRGVGAQVVRKDINQLKANSDDPQYACLRDKPKRDTKVAVWLAPRNTAPITATCQSSPIQSTMDLPPASSDEDEVWRAWSPKCVICDSRLHNEGDFCSVCVPEDAERVFQRFSNSPSLKF